MTTAKRGRRPAGSGTREAILEAARQQFGELGYRHTTLRSIGRLAEVDPRLVLHYFGSKEQLFIESVEPDPRDGGPLVRLWSRGLYPVGPSDRRDPTGVFYGAYDDDVVRTEDGWRIRHRRYRHGS